jgi:hypothetical protein
VGVWSIIFASSICMQHRVIRLAYEAFVIRAVLNGLKGERRRLLGKKGTLYAAQSHFGCT